MNDEAAIFAFVALGTLIAGSAGVLSGVWLVLAIILCAGLWPL